MTRRKVISEASIVKKILSYLNSLPGCRAEKTHGGYYGRAGKPDITGCLWGWRLEFEVKREQSTNRLTPLQRKALENWAAAGAIAAMVTSVEEVDAVLRQGIGPEYRIEGLGKRPGAFRSASSDRI